MNTARHTILNTIRRSLAREKLDEVTHQQLLDRIAHPQTHTKPIFKETLVDKFLLQLEKAVGTIHQLTNIAEIPSAVTRFLQQNQFFNQVVMDSHLQSLNWPTDLEIAYRQALPDDKVSVTGAFAGVAETGSLVLLSSTESPTTLNFLPEAHIVILFTKDIVAHIEDVWPRLREMPTPRTVNFITGPSRTADIEQTLQLGAHGPKKLHVILVSETERS